MKPLFKNKPSRIAFFTFIGLAAITAGSLIVMLLWNALLPALFKLPLISFWQALGVLVLARILFGRHGRPGWARHSHGGWKFNQFRAKWAQMSPEDREKFKQNWQVRCAG